MTGSTRKLASLVELARSSSAARELPDQGVGLVAVADEDFRLGRPGTHNCQYHEVLVNAGLRRSSACDGLAERGSDAVSFELRYRRG
jgi:hypothetical protein